MNRRKLSLLLIVVLLIQFIPMTLKNIVIAGTYNTSTPFYDGTYATRIFSDSEWSQLQITYNIPDGVKKSSKDGKFPFNIELWIEKGITVYGDYSSVPSAKNDFKNATGDLDANGKYIEIPNKGYYKSGTGEYRYHGYDYNLGYYANGDFPVDANSGVKATAKNWIFRIWNISNPYYSQNRISDISYYNKTALGDNPYASAFDVNFVKKWITEGLPFTLSNSNNTDKSVYNYAHVLTAPTTRQMGEVQMYHLSAYDGKPWYQIFSLDTIKQKKITPVDAGISIVGENRSLDGGIKYSVDVTGKLLDDAFYLDEVLKTTNYTRDDISSWSFELTEMNTGTKQTLAGTRISKDKGKANFTVNIPYSVIEPNITKENPDYSPSFSGKATVTFNTGEKSSDTATLSVTVEIQIVDEREPLVINIEAPNEMLDTEKFHIVDSTTGDDYTRTVFLDGIKLSPSEADNFLAGNHLFPLVGQDRIYTYTVSYYDNVTKLQHDYINYVLVYTTKPNVNATVSGTFKENRLITASPNMSGVNSAYLMANASVSATSFDASLGSGNNAILKFGTKNLSTMSFIVKGEDQVNISVQAVSSPNRIERSDIPSGYFYSDPYLYQLYTLPDYEPAMYANIWNGTMTRNELLDMTYDAVSTDQDIVSINTYKIFFDSDKNGTYETLVKQDAWSNYTPYKPAQLGMYKIVFYAEESFGQPTLSQFITSADKKSITVEREFNVDNLAPMTKLFTDIEYDFPQADVIVLNDEGISSTLNSSIKAEAVNWTNGLRQSSIDGTVQIWDLRTYTYEQDASTTYNSGGSYPPSTTSYTSGGYSGTLTRYSISNNKYQVDNGYYKSVSVSKSVIEYDSNSGTADYARNATGWYVVRSYEQNGMRQLSSTMPYDDGNYRGTLNKGASSVLSDDGPPSGGKAGDTYSRSTSWQVPYTGTVTGTTQVWQSNWVWYDDYTGYYSGKIYKQVKQPFTPSFRINADKYLVYFADSAINHMVDIQSIKNKGTVKVILVGKPSTKSLMTYDYFIDSANSLTSIISQVNDIIETNNPYENKQLVQVGETFVIQSADIDHENDPITVYGYQYVQDVNYFDNSMGLETGATAFYSDTSFSASLKNSFSKVGHYKIFRKIKDIPVGNASYTKDSNVPQLDIYVHRKPIANFTLDWDYNSASGTYKTTWVDLSYDLDHQFSDVNKGIVGRKIMYRKTSGDNVWIYSIPDNLTSGTYELRYTVKDIEGAWSDEKVQTFTLSAEPPMQIEAKFKSSDSRYTLTAIPASEDIDVFDIKTEYHKAHQIKLKWQNASSQTLKEGAIFLSSSLPNNRKNNNTYHFYDQTFTIPKEQVDGLYQIIIEATSSSAPFVTEKVAQMVQVKTPVYIVGQTGEMVTGQTLTLSAKTGEYSDRASVTLFEGTPYAKTLNLVKNHALTEVINGDTTFTWSVDYTIPENIPEGNYQFRFHTATAGGNQAQNIVQNEVVAFDIEYVSVDGYWNHWRGQKDLKGNMLPNQPHRFLSYEKVRISVKIKGDAERVSLRFDAPLEAMSYKNSLGQVYHYKDEMGFEVQFPLSFQKSTHDLTLWELDYIIPLCPQTLDWENLRLRAPYALTVTAEKGSTKRQLSITDIEMTGNIYDLLYVQPGY